MGVTGKAVKYRGKPGRRREQPCLHRDGVGPIPAHSGKAVQYRGKPGQRREQPCLHRDGVGAIPAHSVNILVSTVINRAR